jgi:two-component system chemotaxis response regulator CheB
MRRTLRLILEADPEFELVGAARDGEDVVLKARALRPDVVSMDINMPKLDGISALQLLMAEELCPVVMLSSLTQRGAIATFEALELGAFDFVAKPEGTVSDLGVVSAELRAKLKAAATAGVPRRGARGRRGARARHSPPIATPTLIVPPSDSETVAVAIGVSTGGPSTLQEVIPKFPADVNAVFLLVQHMPVAFTGTFAKRLDETSALTVTEATPGEELVRGHCYVARGGTHMTVYRAATGKILIRMPQTPDTLFRPSVNVMMESVLSVFGKKTIGVLMTGIGDDGADQMVRIKESGGYTIAESEESAVVFGMPREAIARGGAREVRPSWEIAEAILRRI